VSQESLLTTISARLGFVDGVVITGGEPTLYSDLGNFIAIIKNMGLSVKLDTNGSHPEILQKLLADNSLDFIAMDIKTSWSKYQMAAGVEVDINKLSRSIDLIKESGIDFEFRTTCVPSLVDENDILEISKLIGKENKYTLQQFSPHSTMEPAYGNIEPYPREMLLYFADIVRINAGNCRLIGI